MKFKFIIKYQLIMALIATPPQTPQQIMQMEAFWNLIQASDETVQYGLYAMLNNKYSESDVDNKEKQPKRSFRSMKGILQPLDISNETLRDDYLTNKYGL